MKLKAVYQIAGAQVVSGKGKGSKVAQPGDIFTADDETGKSLIESGAAVREHEDAPSTGAFRGPDVREESKTPAEKDEELESAPEKPKAKGKGNKAKAGDSKANPVLDDLGLGDGSKDDE